MDKSVERRELFIKQFPFTVKRVPGVVVERARDRLGKGAVGCLLAHQNALAEVSQKEWGWHLICEDDARGPFAEIASNKYVRHLALSKQFINLSKTKKRQYSAVTPYDCSFAYLITPIGARIALEEIRASNFSNAIDAILREVFETPLFWGGNGLGGCVPIIWQEGESEIDKIGR